MTNQNQNQNPNQGGQQNQQPGQGGQQGGQENKPGQQNQQPGQGGKARAAGRQEKPGAAEIASRRFRQNPGSSSRGSSLPFKGQQPWPKTRRFKTSFSTR